MATQSLKTSIPHGVIFVYDPEMEIDLPIDTGLAPIQATQNCLCIWTAGEYENEVDIILSNEKHVSGYCLVFDGFLKTETANVAVLDSSCNVYLSQKFTENAVHICVYADDKAYPTHVAMRFAL